MSKRGRRDVLTSLSPKPIATRSVPRTHRFNVTYTTNKFALSLIEDRRTFNPTYNRNVSRPVVSISVGRPVRLTMKQKPRQPQPSQTKGVLAFAEPNRLPLCIRRHQRREVLFAKGVGGSKKPQRKPRKNAHSNIAC